MKQWLSRHRTWDNKAQRSLRNIKQMRWALISSVLPRQCPGCGTGRKNPGRACLSESRWQSWGYQEAKVCRAKCQKRELLRERILEIFRRTPLSLQLSTEQHKNVKSLPDAKERTIQTIRGNKTQSDHRSGNSACFLWPEMETLLICRILGRLSY